MNYITITTPENIDLRYRLAGAGSRLAAAGIDLIIQGAALFVIILAMLYSLAFANDSRAVTLGGETPLMYLAGFLIIYFVIFYVYHVACETLMNGQSFGKKILRLRAIRENGRPVGLTQSIIRTSVKFFVDYYGVGIILILFSKKCKRLGDMAASTVVVAENPGQVKIGDLRAAPAPFSPQNSVYQGNFALSDEEYYILAEFYSRRNGFDAAASERLFGKIKEYFAKKFGVPESKLNRDVMLRIFEMNRR